MTLYGYLSMHVSRVQKKDMLCLYNCLPSVMLCTRLKLLYQRSPSHSISFNYKHITFLKNAAKDQNTITYHHSTLDLE